MLQRSNMKRQKRTSIRSTWRREPKLRAEVRSGPRQTGHAFASACPDVNHERMQARWAACSLQWRKRSECDRQRRDRTSVPSRGAEVDQLFLFHILADCTARGVAGIYLGKGVGAELSSVIKGGQHTDVDSLIENKRSQRKHRDSVDHSAG